MSSANSRHDLLDSAQRRFDRWRAKRKRGSRIPRALWDTAVAAALDHGVSKTAQSLRVEYYALQRRVEDATAAVTNGAAFVEVDVVPQVNVTEGVVQLEDAKGRRMRVELRGGAIASLSDVATALWKASR